MAEYTVQYIADMKEKGASEDLIAKTQKDMADFAVATTAGQAGGYAERALATAAYTFPVPDGLALDVAVAVFQAGAVARGLLSAMRLSRGDTVLITAAAGRIGSLLALARTRRGSRLSPFTSISKWRWGPVLRPVEPTSPIVCFCVTRCPPCTNNRRMWP